MRRLLPVLLALGAGCSHGPEGPSGAGAFPPAAAFVKGRVRQLAGAEAELGARTDARQGNWKSEAAALAIESRLRSGLVPFLTGSVSAEETARALAAPAFRGASELVPAERSVVFDDGTLRVEEPSAALPEKPAQAEVFAAQLRRWKDSLAHLEFESLEVTLDALEALTEHEVRVGIGLRLVARKGEQALQQNLGWRTTWKLSLVGQAPQLGELVLTRFQSVRAEHPLFRELTRELLGPLACWREELERGTIDYLLHQDRLSRQPVMGMHGIALGDADGDGLEDLYLAQPGGQPNRLLLRRKDGSLHDASAGSGVDLLDNSGPVLFADLDGDGDEDLVIGLIGSVQIYWNDGRGRFPEHTQLPQPDGYESFSMAAADVDNDGDLDLFAARYISGGVGGGTPVPYHDAENGLRNLFWRNEGGHAFTEALDAVGLGAHAKRFSLAVLFEDFDEDGWIDLLVVNDFGRSCLYKNEQGHFRDVAQELGLSAFAAGMGADMADYDGDGVQDLYLTNMSSGAGARIAGSAAFMPEQPELHAAYQSHAAGNSLWRGRADGSFENVSAAAGVAPGGWAWGARFVDWSNSGWPDIFVPNGFESNRKRDDLEGFFWREVIARSPPAPPTTDEYERAYSVIRQLSTFEGWSWSGWQHKYAYLNLQQGRFAEVAGAAALDYLDDSRAAATLDWDDDGRLDLLVRNRTGPRLRVLLGNQRTQNHFLELALHSDGPNHDAIGAQVSVEAGGRRWRASVRTSQGFLCASSRRLHFGLGSAPRAERILVRWPDGQREEFRDVAADARYRILQGAGKLEPRARELDATLDALPGGRVEVQPGVESRIALCDELPVGPWTLPSFSAPAPRVSDFAGKPLLVCTGSFADPRSRAWFEALARARKDATLPACELRLALYDEGARADDARRGIQALGFESCSGPATQAFRQALEVFLVEILGPFQELPQPLALVIDRGGRIVVVHSAPAALADLRPDLETAARADPVQRASELYLCGTWVQRSSRSFEKFSSVLQSLGQSELAQLYAELARARQALTQRRSARQPNCPACASSARGGRARPSLVPLRFSLPTRPSLCE